VSSNGQVVEMDAQLFADVLATYNPQNFKAPLIISHDTFGRDDASLAESELAYGYPSGLKQVGNKIVALFDRVSPRFREWWENGQLMSVSPSLYRPDSPSNPYPGKWSLRHVAALGKSPPAQKDLGQPVGLAEFAKGGFGIPQDWVLNLGEFEQPDDGTVNLSVGGVLPMVLRNLREWFLTEKGAEVADRLIPEYAIAESEYSGMDPELMAMKEEMFNFMGRMTGYEEDFGWGRNKEDDMGGYAKEPRPMGFSEDGQSEAVTPAGSNPMADELDQAVSKPADFTEIEKQLAALEAQNQALQSRLAAEEYRARVASVTNFCEQHRSRLTFDPTAADALDFAEGEATSLVDFMAAQDDKGLAFMQTFIKALPAQVPTGEVASDFNEPAPTANFTEAIATARANLQSIYDKNRNGGAL
jgi:hypothetical protein